MSDTYSSGSYLPDNCTQYDIDRYYGYDQPHDEDPDNLAPLDASNISTDPCECGAPWDHPCKPGCPRSAPNPFDPEHDENLARALAAVEARSYPRRRTA